MVPILKSFDKFVLKLHTISVSDFALSSGTQHTLSDCTQYPR